MLGTDTRTQLHALTGLSGALTDTQSAEAGELLERGQQAALDLRQLLSTSFLPDEAMRRGVASEISAAENALGVAAKTLELDETDDYSAFVLNLRSTVARLMQLRAVVEQTQNEAVAYQRKRAVLLGSVVLVSCVGLAVYTGMRG